MIFFKNMSIKSKLKKIKYFQQSRQHTQPSAEAIAKEVSLYYSLIAIYKTCSNKKKYPFPTLMIRECLRAAASLENAGAQYDLGKQLMEEGQWRQSLQQEEIFANSSNERQAQQLFEEALAYLTAAERLGHVQARRLHGLCYINGWGVEVDKKKGFDLVVESIEQEGSWDKVPQIFAEIGLNKPEFFSALVKHRGKS